MLVAKKDGKNADSQVEKTIIFIMEKAKELHALCALFFIRSNMLMYQSSWEGEW